MPGGDDFGNRPIDFHLMGLGAMGASFEASHGYVEGRVDRVDGRGRLVGARIVLEYPSHTATDNLMMAAALAKGTTVIENAAREPEICDLAAYLVAMGATVRGAGTSRIEVEGVEELTPGRHTVIADRVVAATYLARSGSPGARWWWRTPERTTARCCLRKLGAMGVVTEQCPEGLRARCAGRLRSSDVATLPYPGVATDYKPFLVTMLSVADGVGIVTENLFSGRFRYIDELRRMGADIRTEGHHAVVRGVPKLSGAPVRASDIRAGAALVLAGLVAEGQTEVAAAHHIDRGYEDLAGCVAFARCAGGPAVTLGGTGGPAGVPRDATALLDAAARGDRGALARLLTWVERGGAPSREVAALAYRAPAPYAVGLTGAPGSGKSTLTGRLITAARQRLAGRGGDRGARRSTRCPCWRWTRPRRSPGGRSWATASACRTTRRTRPSTSARWRREGTSEDSRWPSPTPSACSGRRACPWCSSRRSVSGRWRWRWPRPPTPPWWW